MSDWETYRIYELGDVVTGKTPSRKHPEDWGKDMPFVTPTDYKNYRKKVHHSDRYLSEIGIDRLRKKILPPNSIMVTCIGSDMGKVAINNIPVVTNQQINSIIPDENKVDHNFLYYQLVSMYRTLRMYGRSGTAVPIVNKSDFEKIKILLPPLPEQYAIADVLSAFDDKIDLLHCQNGTLEAMAQTLFRQWFVEEEVEDDWEEKPLDQIADYLNGLACQKYPPKNHIDKLPVLKIKELRGGISEISDWASTDISDEYIVHNGDVIFSWSGSLLVKIWYGGDCILNQHLFKVTSSEYPKWFYYFWTKYHLRKFIAIAESKTTTMGHIKRGDLSSSMVLIPSPEELISMDEIISPMIDKLITNSQQIRTLEKLRDMLLQKLMSGEVHLREGSDLWS